MTIRPDSGQEWWHAVTQIAEMVVRGGQSPDDETRIRKGLAERGFSPEAVTRATKWVEDAARSGGLKDAFEMLQPRLAFYRMDHPLERASMSPMLRDAIETYRRRGYLSDAAAERLIEELRQVETRDWEADEVEQFLAQSMGDMTPWLATHTPSALLRTEIRERYN